MQHSVGASLFAKPLLLPSFSAPSCSSSCWSSSSSLPLLGSAAQTAGKLRRTLRGQPERSHFNHLILYLQLFGPDSGGNSLSLSSADRLRLFDASSADR